MEGRKEHLFKVLVIGEIGVGKTSIIKRYVHRKYTQNYRATIGVDFALKVLEWDHDTLIRLQLWDVAGAERFGTMTRVYYREAVGAIVVFDLTKESTFAAINKWKTDLDTKVQLPDGRAIPAVLLGNKCDEKNEDSIAEMNEQMNRYCKEKRFAAWFATSAKTNTNIDEATQFLVKRMLANDHSHPTQEDHPQTLSLSEQSNQKALDWKCCS